MCAQHLPSPTTIGASTAVSLLIAQMCAAIVTLMSPVTWNMHTCDSCDTPVTICEDLSANVLSNHSSALQVHEHTADCGLLGTGQLLI